MTKKADVMVFVKEEFDAYLSVITKGRRVLKAIANKNTIDNEVHLNTVIANNFWKIGLAYTEILKWNEECG